MPFEQGRLLAERIPDARFCPLDSDNHLLLEHEPAFAHFMRDVRSFLAS